MTATPTLSRVIVQAEHALRALLERVLDEPGLTPRRPGTTPSRPPRGARGHHPQHGRRPPLIRTARPSAYAA